MIKVLSVNRCLYTILIVLFFASCSTTKRKLDGKYVNVNNVFNDYYVFNNDNLDYSHHQNKKVITGSFILDNRKMVMIADSINYYNNIDIPVIISQTKSIEESHLSVEEKAYKEFNKSFPNIKLFFVGYPYYIDRNTQPLIVPIDSHEKTFSIENYEYFFEYFRIVGLDYSCGVHYDSKRCNVFEKSFESKLFSLEKFIGSIELKIDIKPLMKNDLILSRSVQVVDSIINSREIIVDGKLYKKI